MADRVLFIGWNRPTPGREKQAGQLFQKAQEFYGKLAAAGRIESFETVILTRHGGDLNGFVMLRGSAEQLAKLREDNDFMEMTISAELCLDGLGLITGFVGPGLMEAFVKWMKQVVS